MMHHSDGSRWASGQSNGHIFGIVSLHPKWSKRFRCEHWANVFIYYLFTHLHMPVRVPSAIQCGQKQNIVVVDVAADNRAFILSVC